MPPTAAVLTPCCNEAVAIPGAVAGFRAALPGPSGLILDALSRGRKEMKRLAYLALRPCRQRDPA